MGPMTKLRMIDDADLDTYQFRMLIHIWRVGECWENLRTIADKCNMSIGKASEVRNWLLKNDYIEYVKCRNGRMGFTISPDEKFSSICSPHETECSPHETECSPHETPTIKKAKVSKPIEDVPNRSQPYDVFVELEKIQRGITKGQTLKDAKKLLADFSLDEIIQCGKWILQDPWMVEKAVPLHSGMIVKRIDRWKAMGKPSKWQSSSNGHRGKKSKAQMNFEAAEAVKNELKRK